MTGLGLRRPMVSRVPKIMLIIVVRCHSLQHFGGEWFEQLQAEFMPINCKILFDKPLDER